MANILSVSIEPALLYTRGLVLERTGAFVESATPQLAVSLIRSYSFDVVVLCHSLPQRDAEEVCHVARTCRPQSKILMLESPVLLPITGVEPDYRLSLEDGPALLVSTTQRLLLIADKPSVTEPARERANSSLPEHNDTAMSPRLIAGIDQSMRASRGSGKQHGNN